MDTLLVYVEQSFHGLKYSKCQISLHMIAVVMCFYPIIGRYKCVEEDSSSVVILDVADLFRAQILEERVVFSVLNEVLGVPCDRIIHSKNKVQHVLLKHTKQKHNNEPLNAHQACRLQSQTLWLTTALLQQSMGFCHIYLWRLNLFYNDSCCNYVFFAHMCCMLVLYK